MYKNLKILLVLTERSQTSLMLRVLIILLFVGQGMISFSQISPGELSRVHSHLEGISNCTKCHTLGEKVSNEKCLACHTEIKARIDQKKGYHSSAEIKGKPCAGCHNDHHGVNFQIIRFDKNKFNHQLAGYTLNGAHTKKKCDDCHKTAFIKDKKLQTKKLTYLGLGTDCLSCHVDYHQKTLPVNCSNCHDNEKFKPASKFDHSKAKFQLTGKHQQASCESCHKISTRGGKKFQEFTGLRYGSCSNCHIDVHEKRFGQNCSDCHNTESFLNSSLLSRFDHTKTGYVLEGKHEQVSCKSCHKGRITDPLKHARCIDCHKDYHEGQFSFNGQIADCSGCHTMKGFAGSTYTLERHNSGIFPLRGAHFATPCIACHKKESKWKFRQIGVSCGDCHEDIHRDKISGKYYGSQGCESCHNVNRWNAVSFDHSKTLFALEGAHAIKTCRDCHFNKAPSGHAQQKFSGLDTRCSSCHADPHFRQFDTEGFTDCRRCHDSKAFVPAPGFDHNKAQFILDGKHSGLACEKCHPKATEQGVTYVLYKTGKVKCEDCH